MSKSFNSMLPGCHMQAATCRIVQEMPERSAFEEDWFKAARVGDDERVAELLAQDARLANSTIRTVGLRVMGGMTALDIAASFGHDKVVARLLAAKAPCGFVLNSLQYAAMEGHYKVVALLLAERPDLVTRDIRTGVNALEIAIEGRHEKVCHQLVTACPALVDVHNNNCPVLFAAVRKGYDNLVARILALRPEAITAVDGSGWNPLHTAVFQCRQDIAERLLAAKPELIFGVSAHGETILRTAVIDCSDEFVAKLWRMNPQALHPKESNFNTDPFYLAVSLGKNGLIELFQWSLSFDEIVNVFTALHIDYEERYRPVLARQCETLWESLNRDVMGLVFEYLGFTCTRNSSQWQPL